jgi:hypothetical protein
MLKYGGLDAGLNKNPDAVQLRVEGYHLDARIFLQRYELPIEGQRHRIHSRRQEILEGKTPCSSEFDRLITLRATDDLCAGYLAHVAEFRSGLPWLEWGLGGLPWLTLDPRDAHYEYRAENPPVVLGVGNGAAA